VPVYSPSSPPFPRLPSVLPRSRRRCLQSAAVPLRSVLHLPAPLSILLPPARPPLRRCFVHKFFPPPTLLLALPTVLDVIIVLVLLVVLVLVVVVVVVLFVVVVVVVVVVLFVVVVVVVVIVARRRSADERGSACVCVRSRRVRVKV